MSWADSETNKINTRLQGESYKKFIKDAQLNGEKADPLIPIAASLIKLNYSDGLTANEMDTLLKDYTSNPNNRVTADSKEKIEEYFTNAFITNLKSSNGKSSDDGIRQWTRT